LLGTLRQRVVASFVILVGISLLGVGTYVYFQTEHKLMQEVDSSLRSAASQALLSLEQDSGRLVFRGNGAALSSEEGDAEFALRHAVGWRRAGYRRTSFASSRGLPDRERVG
jgi:hypothetical protein